MDIESKVGQKSILVRFLHYLSPYRIQIVCLVCLSILTALTSLGLPLGMKVLIDEVIGRNKSQLLYFVIPLMIALVSLQGLMNYLNSYLFGRLSQQIIYDIRLELFRRMQSLDATFFDKAKTGDLVSRFLNDVNELYFLISDTVVNSASNILILVVSMTALLFLNAKLSIIVLVTLPLYAFVFSNFNQRIRRIGMESRHNIAEVSSCLHESLAGIRTIKLFNQEKHMYEKFRKSLNEYLSSSMSLVVNGSSAKAIINIISGISPIVVFAMGVSEVVKGRMTIGSLIAFYAIIGYLYSPIQSLSQMNVNLQATTASLQRVLEIIDMRPQILGGTLERVFLKEKRGEIVFDNVWFRYDRTPVFKGLSFRIDPGDRVAFIGPTGAGKTTIFNLLLRLYDADSGVITVNGTNIKQFSLEALREQVGIVSQDIFLFNDSIANNVRFGHADASLEKIIEAAQLAQIHDFISSLPDGYNTTIGERGVQLSGGERQRIAIARAIIRDPQILLFDEATSSLDNDSERLVQQAMEKLMIGKTSLIIAHRLSTIRDVDRILVIEGGALVDEGTHADLMRSRGLYWQLYTHLNPDIKV